MITTAIVAGSRMFVGFQGAHLVEEAILKSNWSLSEIISGNCRGIDEAAEVYATNRKIDLTIMPANWNKYGKRAGPMRNARMIDYATWRNGGLIAIWNGQSTGTAGIIKLAEQANIPIFLLKVK